MTTARSKEVAQQRGDDERHRRLHAVGRLDKIRSVHQRAIEHDAVAAEQMGQHTQPAAGEIDRHGREISLRTAQSHELLEAQNAEIELKMGDLVELRRARAAGGGRDDEWSVPIARQGGERVAPGDRPLPVGAHRRDRTVERRGDARLRERQIDGESRRHLRRLGLRGTPIERHGDRAHARHGEKRDDVLPAVPETQADAISRSHAARRQLPGRPQDEVGKLAVVDQAIAVDQRRRAGTHPGTLEDRLGQVHRTWRLYAKTDVSRLNWTRRITGSM